MVAALTPAGAHDLWLEREGDTYTLYYGHLHQDPSHGGARRIEYAPGAVKGSACFDASGAPRDVTPQAGAYPWRLVADCAVTCVLTSSGYWTKTPFGTRNVPKTEAQGAVASWLSVEGVKRVDAWSEALARPLTPDLEVVPLNDPLALREGDKLRLQVTFGGRPVPGVTVAYDGRTRGETDAEGRVNLRVRHGGLQLVVASWRAPLASELADEVVHTATLVFESEGRP